MSHPAQSCPCLAASPDMGRVQDRSYSSKAMQAGSSRAGLPMFKDPHPNSRRSIRAKHSRYASDDRPSSRRLPKRLQSLVLRVVHLKHSQQFGDLQQVSHALREIRQLDGSPGVVRGSVQRH